MISAAWVVAIFVATMAVLLHQLGIFDRPDFFLRDKLFPQPMVVFAATCTDPDIGANIGMYEQERMDALSYANTSTSSASDVVLSHGMVGYILLLQCYIMNVSRH